jgi:hypothetical protein
MVAFIQLGEYDMRSPSSRKNKRAKAQELTLFILDTQKEMEYAELAAMISKAMRAKVNGSNLAQLCKPLLRSGEIVAERKWDGNESILYWKRSC